MRGILRPAVASLFSACLLLRALPAWSVHPCIACHPREVAGYSATQMAHSLGAPTRVTSATFKHALSNTVFSVQSTRSGMVQRIERNGLQAEYKIPYAVGSGAHAFAYLIQVGDHMFESPIGYFPGRGWDMSPGYENSKAPDFDRPVTPDCLFCHAGKARPLPGAFNRYLTPPFQAEAITCERCHGPVEAHLRSPLPGSIVNPAKLPPRARDSVCEQCHLNGEERIPNPGKQLSDFRPGQDLEDVYSVYVYQSSVDPSHHGGLRVVSQVQQLALSACARQSHGNLWCGTCHDPHVQPANPKAYFRARCLTCHRTDLARHPKPNEDCIGCHMPRRPVTDGAHTTFTDHRISRVPASEPLASGPQQADSVIAWHNPPGNLPERNLGLADIKVGDRLESFALVNRGFESLMDCRSSFPRDPAVLTGIGKALLVAGRGREAAEIFEQAIQSDPDTPFPYLNAALAWRSARDDQKAVQSLEKAIALDPLLEQPYQELGAIYSDHRDIPALRQTAQRYLKAFPASISAQMAVQLSSR